MNNLQSNDHDNQSTAEADVNQKLADIKDVLETVRIYIQQDGGDMEFISYEDNVVTVKILGACIGCSMTDITYQAGLQEILRDEIDPKIVVKLVEEIQEISI